MFSALKRKIWLFEDMFEKGFVTDVLLRPTFNARQSGFHVLLWGDISFASPRNLPKRLLCKQLREDKGREKIVSDQNIDEVASVDQLSLLPSLPSLRFPLAYLTTWRYKGGVFLDGIGGSERQEIHCEGVAIQRCNDINIILQKCFIWDSQWFNWHYGVIVIE